MIKLFFDIETIEDVSVPLEIREKNKEKYWDDYNFLPEFHRILCISCGYRTKSLSKTEDQEEIKIKSFSLIWSKDVSESEKQMIVDFYKAIDWVILWGFNIKNFDIPFIIKRGLKLWIPVPISLRSFGKKPWEFDNLIDLYDVYKFMGRTSANLENVCLMVWIPTPKDGIDWSQVQEYFNQWKLQEIVDYCERDVEASILVYEKFKELNVVF